MGLFENLTIRRYLLTLVIVLTTLAGVTTIVIKTTTDHLLYREATQIAQRWAQFLADNVTDLEQIAAGEAPSSASFTFLSVTKSTGEVFRYTIFNRYGYSMLVADREKVTPLDLSEFDAVAAESVKREIPIVDAKQGQTAGAAAYFAQAYVSEKTQAEALSARIRPVLGAPVHYKEQEMRPTFTVGVALAPDDGDTVERLLRSADLALFAGKEAGRDCVRFFAREMDESLQKRMRLEQAIRDAIAHDGFVLYYQPIVDVAGGRLVGFEALLRLPGSDGKLISPTEFIPIAEEMRVIDKIGAWVSREACRTAATWPGNLTVAVNLSPAQFETGEVEEAVTAALDESGLAPRRLELEITETLLLTNTDATLNALRRLKEKGLSVVMDDFGTGYSSLSYLWKFPFDKIKIDRSIMEGFETSGGDVETVVKTIIALSREINIRVTVEGVEAANQVDFLYDARADEVQGFYFGEPLPAARLKSEVSDRLRDGIVAVRRPAETSA